MCDIRFKLLLADARNVNIDTLSNFSRCKTQNGVKSELKNEYFIKLFFRLRR